MDVLEFSSTVHWSLVREAKNITGFTKSQNFAQVSTITCLASLFLLKQIIFPCAEHGLTRQGAYNVANKISPSHKGWVFSYAGNEVDHMREQLMQGKLKRILVKDSGFCIKLTEHGVGIFAHRFVPATDKFNKDSVLR